MLEEDDPISDPLEGANRALFRVNQGIDDYFWDPLVTGYQFVFPEPARRVQAGRMIQCCQRSVLR